MATLRKRNHKYRIPELWNCWGFEGNASKLGKQIAVDPEAYLRACLDWIGDRSILRGRVAGRSLSQCLGIARASEMKVREGSGVRRAGDWIRSQTMYGMMVRMTTAWDHDGNGRLAAGRTAKGGINEMGTFLKSILLLPHLHRMGVTCLYILPVAKVSHLYRKGELGCPYSAKNYFELDPAQYDGAFGASFGDVNEQFRLFVESAHRLGMRLMLDIAPRTAARDSDWILDNPEWFYWIDKKHARTYKAPIIPGVTYLNPVPGKLHEIYDVPEVQAHLAKFRFAPSVTAPKKWASFVKTARKNSPKNLLTEIAKQFGVITPPGFSDVVNDRQPPWSDVTYLRLFEDHPVEAAKHLPDPVGQPPYVLYDSAKASMFGGGKPVRALWKNVADIIPFYQKFGVDGARVDMAHALPKRLEELILEKPRRRDPDFCFLAEELGTGNHAEAHKGGYNIIIGPSWWMQPRGHEGFMHKMVAELPGLKTPIMAAAETPDTPRATARHGGRKFAAQAVVVNCFLPNAVPMVNCGIEVFERQPMNLGLDAKPKDRFALPKSDPLYGKLAFFDRFAVHWGNAGGEKMSDLIGRASALRTVFLKDLTRRSAYFSPKVNTNAKTILATGFKLGKGKGILVMLANLDYRSARRTSVTVPLAGKVDPELLLQVGDSPAPRRRGKTVSVTLAAGEAMVCRV